METGTTGDAQIDPSLMDKVLMAGWLTEQHSRRNNIGNGADGIFVHGISGNGTVVYDATRGHSCYGWCKEDGSAPDDEDSPVSCVYNKTCLK